MRARTAGARLFELILWLSTAACTTVLVVSAVEAEAAHRAAAAIQPAPARQAAEDATAPAIGPAASPTTPGSLLGRLEIPALGVSVPVLESDDPLTLTRGVGHIPGTALPGGLGNLVLAGHRDTFFRPLRNVRPGMIVEVITPTGRWQYAIDGTKIVDPSDVDVLDIGDRPDMTLITCYPFHYIGAAPRRFIVHAHLLSLDPA